MSKQKGILQHLYVSEFLATYCYNIDPSTPDIDSHICHLEALKKAITTVRKVYQVTFSEDYIEGYVFKFETTL